MPADNLNQDPTKPGFINLYAFFKINDKASDSEIDKSFRKMSMAWHPDKNRNNPEAAGMFAKLSAWRDLLKDSERRAEYNTNLVWFNTEKQRRNRPPPPREHSSSSSSYSHSEYTERPSDTSTYARSSGPRRTSEYSSYEPPRYESREPRDYSPRYESREPSDYAPRFETREPSDFERRRPRSSRPRDDAGCQCPDCEVPPRSSRPSRNERVYEEPPRFETRMPPSRRSSRRGRESDCACPDCRPLRRSAQRQRPEYVIIEEIIDVSDFDDDFDNGFDDPFFEQDIRRRPGPSGRYNFH